DARLQEIIEKVADVDDDLAEIYLSGEAPTPEQLHAAIRRATIALKMTPVFCGSAYKNKGVQKLLDAVTAYLPNPTQVVNKGLDQKNNEAEVEIPSDPAAPFVGLAFKLED